MNPKHDFYRGAVLPRDFFIRDTLTVARDLLGTKLVRRLGDKLLSGMIVETEAYLGRSDSASHAFRGRTARNEVMFGRAGSAYVYLVYGLHHMLNAVTEIEGVPGAVLLRAIEPLQGQQYMQTLRNGKGQHLTNGPGKLCQALAIDRRLNREDLTQCPALWLEVHETLGREQIASGPRIGIGYAARKDQQAPWRFWIKGNQYISK